MQLFASTTALVYKSSDNLSIDGNLNEESWQKAEVLSDFVFPWGDDSIRGTITNARLLWDDSAFYIGATLLDKSIVSHSTTENGMDGDEMFEIHIATDIYFPQYFHILEFTPNLVFRNGFRQAQPSGKNGWRVDWDLSNIETAITFQGTKSYYTDIDTSWTIEMKIPFTAVEGWNGGTNVAPTDWNPTVPPVNKTIWAFNLTRSNFDLYNDYTNHDYSVWSHNGNYPYGLTGVHFHDHNNFGKIRFIDTLVYIGTENSIVNETKSVLVAYPNPFNPIVNISINNIDEFKNSKLAQISIYNALGSLVYKKNTNSVIWNAKSQPSGIYLVVVKIGSKLFSKKISLLK